MLKPHAHAMLGKQAATRFGAGLCALAAAFAPAPGSAQKVLAPPPEKMMVSPGGVDMRSGRYAYSQTDLSIGGEAGLALTRTINQQVLAQPSHLLRLRHEGQQNQRDEAARRLDELSVSGGMTMRRFLAALAAAFAAFGSSAALAQASPSAFTTGYRYDAMHRLTGVIEPDPDGSGPLRYPAVRNTYDRAGRLIRVEKGELQDWQSEGTAPRDWPGFAVAEQSEALYDALDRKTVEGIDTGNVISTFTQYSYDNVGRLDCTAVRMNPASFLPFQPACAFTAQGSQGPDRITRNVYDAAGQLLKVQKAYGTPLQQDYATYEYTPDGKQKAVIDANGNRAEVTYDGHDRQSRWIFPSAANGAVANPADYEEYAYDPNGNRVTLKKRDGSLIGYQYDALDRVTVKTVPTSATGAAG